MSNPEVAEQWLEDAVGRASGSTRGTMVISASPNDNGYMGYCVCENCRAWDNPDAPMLESPLLWRGVSQEHRALTDRYARFWNSLAHGLKERLPGRDVYIGVWAYHAYRPAPVAVKLEDNIIVGYVGIRRRNPMENSASNIAEQYLMWKEWADQTDGLIWRPNLINRSMGMPYNFMQRHAADMRFLADNKMVGINVDSLENHWATQGPQYYLTARLAWDPYADADAIMKDYYQRAFGPAAEAIENYFNTFEEHYYWLADNYGSWHNRRGVLPAFREYPMTHPSGGGMAIDELAKLWLEQAEANVRDADERFQKRVAFVRTGYDYITAHLDAIAAMDKLRANPDNRDLREQADEAVRRRHDILTRACMDFSVSYLQLQGDLQNHPDDFGPQPDKAFIQ